MHEVYRGAPELCLSVQLGTLLHEVAHISDVHTDFIDGVCDFIDTQCIIEILGGNGIDGKDTFVSEVHAEINLLLRYFPLARLIVNVLSEYA
jgi:hypothetical protein